MASCKNRLIKIKPKICVLYILCSTWAVNANSLNQNIIGLVIKENMFFLAATLVGCILPTLKYRRLRGDMIEVFKITHNIYDRTVL